MSNDTDVIVVGAGPAGLVATAELINAGRCVILLDFAGFGGGGLHGYRALEGTFLGGCLFSGRISGRTVAKNVL
jgi:predicted oxidoreductase